MVCRAGQTCLIQFDLLFGSQDKTLTPDRYPLRESTRGKDLYDYIKEHCHIQADRFKLFLSSAGRLIDLSGMKDKTMLEVGVDFSFDRDSTEHKHTLLVTDPKVTCKAIIIKQRMMRSLSTCNSVQTSANLSSICEEDKNVDVKSIFKSETCYVGLVNQAMTCYLNSLLQALYMTPEFRNALYNWEYVNGSETDEANSIPYQLQKLFLNLQTSTKSAVETTALTKSFGWDSTEAWQQHDIQELCRVMFDALEQKFKNTEQADLINRLYEGMMTDYVKCLECETEKSREDAFLDIPLPVRPFGSDVAYNSVEEALRAFVQYETLDGSNQYYCEKCNKKCNAHKGLKFTKFPYLLTLHLKRFDFDFKTFHRVKLNDKVTFPDILNLNPFISSTRNQESPSSDENIDLVKCEDGSTTDNGTLDDDYTPCENSLPNSNHSRNHDHDDDDEGIFISGSASGGHYYAYIKDFRTQEWLSFNDQSVTQITHDDIQKTYGGGPTRPYYSGAYSSTNAYMLMYRQIDPARNALPMQVPDFPKHIQELLTKMKENEDNDRKSREKEPFQLPKDMFICSNKEPLFAKEVLYGFETMRVPIEFHSRSSKFTVKIYSKKQRSMDSKMESHKISFYNNARLADATEQCYRYFHLKGVVRLNRCRLVHYDAIKDKILRSFEGREVEKFHSLSKGGRYTFLFEIREEDEEFQQYQETGFTTKVYIVDVNRKSLIEGPIDVPGLHSQTVKEYKQVVGKMVNMDLSDMKLVLQHDYIDTHFEPEDEVELGPAGFVPLINVYISNVPVDELQAFHFSALYEIIENHKNIITLRVELPETSKEIFEELNIPRLDERCKDKDKPIADSPSKVNVNDTNCEVGPKCNDVPKSEKSNEDTPVRNASPQLGESEEWNTPEQSNSEDSSLSDSDKTLVGDAPEDDDLQVPYLPLKMNNRDIDMLNQIRLENWINVDEDKEYYFNATPCTDADQKYLKVTFDKRMMMSTFKKCLEPYVGVPAEYFKLFYYANEHYGREWRGLKKTLLCCENEQKFCIKLGPSLHNDDFTVMVYQFLIKWRVLYKFLGDWTLTKDMTVGQAKREILSDIKKKHDIDIPYDRCRLREKRLSLASTVYLDDEKLEKYRFHSQSEIILQELPDKEPVTNSDQVVLFVRRWSPANAQLGPLEEIVMDGNSLNEMKKKLSTISDIPEEYIEVARTKSYFPSNVSIGRIENEQGWIGNVLDSEFDSNDGSMFLYRDNREERGNLNTDSLNDDSNYVLNRVLRNSRRTRKEKALRIHLSTE
ncbi:ubiquitin carboxyl-terminal hydrolase 47 isoform X2 [Hylaeus anthracinus]|uniref:ubiquitin carboxyl-terminal hydrolase 47 isoform X2 n=1 Tax=Hylaeus volcanicus TaxID=313075 RepID=UPI0023B7862E|nr:ubiquitin carboxyl-terminal hydrolase 47 isoform X2 [Hylaeus volcanicus]XP_054013165.1 ubiquitin carboxyl-terminal hydrolase 47 isoform X2 [Hylaeus anthracinus]